MSDGPSGRDRWRTVLRERYGDEIRDLAGEYPRERSLYVDVIDLHDYDPEFARALLSAPDRQLRLGADALRDLHDGFDRVNVRVENHPGLIGVEDLRTRHLGELVTVEADAVDAGPVEARIASAAYRCRSCGATTVRRAQGLSLARPAACSECGAEEAPTLDRDASEFVDARRVRLVPVADDGDRGVDAYVDDDLVDAVDPEGRVRVTAIPRLERPGSRNRFTYYLDAVTVVEDPSSDRPDPDSPAAALQEAIESRWHFVTGG